MTDDLSNVNAQPHVVRGKAYEDDHGRGVADGDSGPEWDGDGLQIAEVWLR